MRVIAALVAAAAVAALGAVVLGEYTFSGAAVLGSGLIFGLFVAEAALALTRLGRRSRRDADRERRERSLVAGGCAAVALGGMTWAGWISTGHDLSFLEPEGWVAVILAGVTAGLRARWTRPAGDSSPREPAPAE